MENKNFTGSHAQKAENYFKSGYTCAQSVLLAFEDLTHIDSGTAFAMAAPFGGGVARMRDLCGAVSGMLMVAGILYAPKRPMNHEEKTNFYKLCQSLVQTFREKNASIVCRELLGETGTSITYIPEERTEEYYQKRPCAGLAASAAAILDDYLTQNPPASLI